MGGRSVCPHALACASAVGCVRSMASARAAGVQERHVPASSLSASSLTLGHAHTLCHLAHYVRRHRRGVIRRLHARDCTTVTLE